LPYRIFASGLEELTMPPMRIVLLVMTGEISANGIINSIYEDIPPKSTTS